MADEEPTLKIKQGATYGFGFTWYRDAEDQNGDPILDDDGNPTPGNPFDLADCSARMQIRRKKGEPVLVLATSANAFPGGTRDEVAIAAGAGRITLEGGDGSLPGHVHVLLTDQDTEKLISKTAVFDLEIEWPQGAQELRPRVDRPLQGKVEVSLNITEG